MNEFIYNLIPPLVYTAVGNSLSQEAERHYNSATKSKVYADGNIPNVIKAYYVAYLPDPKFVIPSVDIRNPISVISISDTDLSRKRPRDDTYSTDSTYSTNNLNRENNTHTNRTSSNTQKNKIEIFESKKYHGKYFFIDSKTNNSVWVEILKNGTNGGGENVFNANSNISDFHFIDMKNEKCGILKATFAPK